MISQPIDQQLLLTLLQKSVKITLIAITGWVVQRLIIFSLKKFRRGVKKSNLEPIAQTRQRVNTVTSLLINVTKIVINFAVFLLLLSEFGINILPIITGVGILGLAIGMGAKDLASDIIAGFFILLENRFNIGDQLKIGPVAGKVVRINLRTITLKEKSGDTHIIPNSSLKIVTKIKL